MPQGHQNIMLPNVCQTHRGVCVRGMGSVHKEEHQICGECAASSCRFREERLHSTQQYDHHDRMYGPFEQAGGSQARDIIPYRKQPRASSGRNNILTHCHSYLLHHQRQFTTQLTTIHPHRSLQTLLFPSTIKSWNKYTQQLVSKQSLD